MRIDLLNGFHLSQVQAGDQAAYVEHFRDKETVDNLLLIPFPYTEKDAEEWVQSRLEAAAQGVPEAHFAIRREDGFLVGGAGLDMGVGTGSHRAEIGYWVAKDYRRRGLAGAALRAMTSYAFNHLGVKRLQAWTYPNNLASRRLLKNTGFQHEGLLRGYHLKNGILRDASIYGLVKNDA